LLRFSQAAFTSRVLAIDADFTPSVGASALLQQIDDGGAGDARKIAFVVPIFTENGNHILPYTTRSTLPFYY
jgi:hypothetical protein